MCKEEIYINMYISFLVSKFLIFVCGIHPRSEEDDLNWVLLETKADGSHNDRVIEGFLEDDFNEDDYDWEAEDES